MAFFGMKFSVLVVVMMIMAAQADKGWSKKGEQAGERGMKKFNPQDWRSPSQWNYDPTASPAKKDDKRRKRPKVGGQDNNEVAPLEENAMGLIMIIANLVGKAIDIAGIITLTKQLQDLLFADDSYDAGKGFLDFFGLGGGDDDYYYYYNEEDGEEAKDILDKITNIVTGIRLTNFAVGIDGGDNLANVGNVLEGIRGVRKVLGMEVEGNVENWSFEDAKRANIVQTQALPVQEDASVLNAPPSDDQPQNAPPVNNGNGQALAAPIRSQSAQEETSASYGTIPSKATVIAMTMGVLLFNIM